MVRVRLLSDVHTELAPYSPSDVEADLVVLAGDIGKGVRGVQWATRWFPEVPVVYVPGNHEYYGGALPRVTAKMRSAAEGTNVAVLDREAWLGTGVRVLGATLWTDFALFGVSSVFASSEAARAGLNDYRRIRTSPRFSKLRPIDTQREHRESLAWLRARLAEKTDGPTIVVTHHAPSLRSIAPQFSTDPLTPAYASNLDELVESSGAVLWLHGHTHHASDYRIGDTRVVCNPRGYADDLVPGFGPRLVLEV